MVGIFIIAISNLLIIVKRIDTFKIVFLSMNLVNLPLICIFFNNFKQVLLYSP